MPKQATKPQPKHWGLYRAQRPMYNLLHAIEEIAKYLEEKHAGKP